MSAGRGAYGGEGKREQELGRADISCVGSASSEARNSLASAMVFSVPIRGCGNEMSMVRRTRPGRADISTT
jgi:hypothetical protein